DRDGAVQLQVVSRDDDPHPSRPDRALDAVFACDHRPDRRDTGEELFAVLPVRGRVGNGVGQEALPGTITIHGRATVGRTRERSWRCRAAPSRPGTAQRSSCRLDGRSARRAAYFGEDAEQAPRDSIRSLTFPERSDGAPPRDPWESGPSFGTGR